MVIVFILVAFSTVVSAKGVEVPDNIRVGLFYGTSAVGTLEISSPGGIEIGVLCDGEFEYIDEVGANEEIKIEKFPDLAEDK